MYDPPELRDVTDTLWSALAAALEDEGVHGVPRQLTRDRHHRELWGDPHLLWSQTCGYPLARHFAGRLRVVATPRYAVPECVGSWYTSRVVVRADSPARGLADLRGAVCAANEIDSHSGTNAFRALVAPIAFSGGGGRFFSAVKWSGGHRMSLEMVVKGEADVAAIDCITFALLSGVRPELTSTVREIARTAPCPGLPFVTPASTSDDELARMRAALARVFDDPATAEARAALLFDGFEILPEDAYQTVLDLEAAACRLGYPELA